MISDRSPGPVDRTGARLANEVEGYLLLQAERDQAQHEARTLCSRMPWLTTAQAEDLARHYIEQRLGLTRQALQITADRAHRLRAEYEARYADLRHTLLKRHAACATLLLAAASTAGTTTYLLNR
ncbi:hypothetical protein [Streptomyces rishiriensis]|uniref:Uncharacterized protein n=1 Tax=Streptomyces rishiriensis TaxID=68264 RepID=A0ABU0P4N8_STRRH|nr:hypothetical protein [Streptomyces rishiriensis]MDQ0585717.1 hypothetical protein [Streptomyces rishiriensis]